MASAPSVPMFEALAPHYDLMNRLISLGADGPARKRLVEALGPLEGKSALDVATGTGDLAIALAMRGAATRGEDLAEGMLALAREKAEHEGLEIAFGQGDASAPSGEWDILTVGWGLRNLPDVGGSIQRQARVLRPGGLWACLDLTQPSNPIWGLLLTLWLSLLPLLARCVGAPPDAYRYLANSVRTFPRLEALRRSMERAGLDVVLAKGLFPPGLVLLVGRKARRPSPQVRPLSATPP